MPGGELTPHVARRLASSGKRIVITGAGGWLGMATLDLLKSALGGDFPVRVRCFGSSARDIVLVDGTRVAQQPLAAIGALNAAPSLVLHLAFLTKDHAADMAEADYVRANRDLSATVHAALDRIGATAVFVASSGAAAVADDPARPEAMRLYGGLKQADESLFSDWATERGRTAVIGRIFNIAGPYINKHQNYALASFILDALAGRPVVVRAPHRVVRGYVAISELMSLVLAMMMSAGPPVRRFDSGGEPMELGEVAAHVAARIGDGTVERAAITSDQEDCYASDDRDYRRLLAEHRIRPVAFEQQILETARYLAAETVESP